MRRAWPVLLFLPLAAAVHADDHAAFHAELTLSVRLDVQDLYEFHGLEATSGWPSSCTVPQAQASDTYLVAAPHIESFRFRETDRENGCAEARFRVPVPDRVSVATVHFEGDRWVKQGTDLTPGNAANAHQRVRFYPDLVGLGREQTAAVESAYYEPEALATDHMEAHSARFLVPANVTHLGVGWFFAETGGMAIQPAMNPAFGWHFAATVTRPSVHFGGRDVPWREVDEVQSISQGRRVVESTIQVEVPDVPRGFDGQVSVQLPAGVLLQAILGPDGRSLLGVFDVEDGAQRVVIPAEVLAARGPGTYELQVLSTSSAQPQLSMSFLFVGALVTPIAAGLLAQRSVVHLHRSQERTRWFKTLEIATIGLGVGYAAIIGAAVARQGVVGLFSAPMTVGAQLFYGAAGVTLVGFLAVIMVARREEFETITSELTQKHQMEKELQRSNAELEQFAYVASHDLKEPLRMVAGYTQLLERRYEKDLDSRAKEYLGYAAEGASRMQDMIDDLLTYARLSSGDERSQPVDLAAAIHFAKEHLTMRFAETDARLDCDNLPIVLGDRGRIVQLFQNLMQNSLKFRHPDRRPVMRVSAERKGRRWLIHFEDNGIGMEGQDADRAFQIFQRLHRREKYEGTGIGLAVCRKIVDMHGGQISVVSEKGKGASFKFDLPAIE